ncbi:glycosyltransferase family 4 protein [Geomicrobium sp. JSM 1781026]|uniref:glycosyltransferase family 4 protein n=1 Tax=Geomicrobium sp. JSM 1781026 TaxID=3344580 RepID=UPI0035C060EA
MNVTIDVRMLNNSGIGTYLKNIIPYIIQEGIHISLIGQEHEISELGWNEFKNVEVIACDFNIYSIKEQISLKEFVPNYTDLLWVPHFNVPINYRGKLLVTIHDVFHLAMAKKVGGLLKRYYSKKLYKNAVDSADHIITVSEFSRKELLQHLALRIHDSKIKTIYNGVSPSWFKLNKNIQISSPYIVFVGNVKPHKNLRILLEAFDFIKDQFQIELVIVGKKDGFINGDNKLLTEQLKKMDDKIKFTGYVSDFEIKNYISNAQLLVFPSLYEGFGLPPLEAMASGVPTVVSNVASMPEVCGDATIYFNPTDSADLAQAIEKVLNDKNLQKHLINKGKENALKFTWEKSAGEHISLLKELCKS